MQRFVHRSLTISMQVQVPPAGQAVANSLSALPKQMGL
jgi:hypothetical protein